MDLSQTRKDYSGSALDPLDLNPDPRVQFTLWFAEAEAAGLSEPNAMALATADLSGQPSVRMVLLKSLDERGLVFCTNYGSRKGRDLEQNPRAALLFFWDRLERQVRIEGTTERCSEAESDAAFAVRPRGSRLGAWASPQSEVLTSRAELEQRLVAVEGRFPGEEVARPPFWGGLRLVPERYEFWQGRASRLHDRVQYRRLDGIWQRERLAP